MGDAVAKICVEICFHLANILPQLIPTEKHDVNEDSRDLSLPHKSISIEKRVNCSAFHSSQPLNI